MSEYVVNLVDVARRNEAYRRVFNTDAYWMQVAVMTLQPGAATGAEVHPTTAQLLRVEEGVAAVTIDGRRSILRAGWTALVRPGERHNVENLDDDNVLRLSTVYAPPQHRAGQVDQDRETPHRP